MIDIIQKRSQENPNKLFIQQKNMSITYFMVALGEVQVLMRSVTGLIEDLVDNTQM